MTKIIVLIDDDQITNLLHRNLINSWLPKVKVIVFEGARDALHYLYQTRIDPSLSHFIFLDVNMPIMNGWAFLEELKDQHPEIPVNLSLLTSSEFGEDVERAKSHPLIAYYFTKPLDVQEIVGWINFGGQKSHSKSS